MNVLIACEESQEVCQAFRKRGHNAFSCDIIPCSGGHPEWHILGDVTKLLKGNATFILENGEEKQIKGFWDIIIGFPPCTYMTTASACRMYHKDENGNSYLDQDRIKNMIISRDLFMNILNAPTEKICVEIQLR